MKFATIRDLRAGMAKIRKQLEEEQDIVLTANGRPIALLSRVDADNVEEQLLAVRRARARTALDRIRQGAKAKGLDRMSMSEIDRVVARARRSRSPRSRRGQ